MPNFFKRIAVPPQFSKFSPRLFKKAGSVRTESAPIVACDFEKSKIVFLEVQNTSPKIRLIKFQKMSRAADNPAKDSDFLKECFEAGGFSTSRLRISMKGQGVIVRFIQFPQMKPEDLRTAISFEVDQYIPFKAHEVVWDFCVLEENIPMASGAKGMNILLAAVKREDLEAHLQIFQEAGFEIDLVDISALAALNALEFFHPKAFQSAVGVLDLGIEISTLSIVRNGKPQFIRDISYGSFDIVKRLKRKIGLSQDQALAQLGGTGGPAPEVFSVIQEGIRDLASELRVSLNYYIDQVQSAEPIKLLFVSGGIVHPLLFLDNLKNETDLGFEIQAFDILGNIEAADTVDMEMLKRNAGMLPVALGLCLRSHS